MSLDDQSTFTAVLYDSLSFHKIVFLDWYMKITALIIHYLTAAVFSPEYAGLQSIRQMG